MATTETELKPLPLVLGDSYIIEELYADHAEYIQTREAFLLARAEDRRLYEQGLRQQVLRLKHQGFEREKLSTGELQITLRTLLDKVMPHDGTHVADEPGGHVGFVEFVSLHIMPTVPDKCKDHLQLLCGRCSARYNSSTGELIG